MLPWGIFITLFSIVFVLIERKLQRRECNVMLRLQDYNTPGVQGGEEGVTQNTKEKIKLPLHA